MIEKLANIGPIVVINLEHRKDRKRYIEKLFSNAGVINYKFFKAIEGKSVEPGNHRMSHGEIGCSMSHLTVLSEWLNSDNEDVYLLVMEDDVSLDTVKYWRWSWEEFVSSISFKFDILHLTPPSFDIDDPDKLRIRPIDKSDIPITTTCYMVSKAGAKKIIDRHTLDGELFFNPDDRDNVADHQLLYGVVDFGYSLPLFAPAVNLGTDINPKKEVIEVLAGLKNHIEWLLENSTTPLSSILDLPPASRR